MLIFSSTQKVVVIITITILVVCGGSCGGIDVVAVPPFCCSAAGCTMGGCGCVMGGPFVVRPPVARMAEDAPLLVLLLLLVEATVDGTPGCGAGRLC